MGFCLVSWAQILRYHHKWPAWKATLTALIVACAFAGVEVALVITLKPLYEQGSDTGILAVGIVADILLAAGLLPPYREIWKRRGRVIGINWVCLTYGDCRHRLLIDSEFVGRYFSRWIGLAPSSL